MGSRHAPCCIDVRGGRKRTSDDVRRSGYWFGDSGCGWTAGHDLVGHSRYGGQWSERGAVLPGKGPRSSGNQHLGWTSHGREVEWPLAVGGRRRLRWAGAACSADGCAERWLRSGGDGHRTRRRSSALPPVPELPRRKLWLREQLRGEQRGSTRGSRTLRCRSTSRPVPST